MSKSFILYNEEKNSDSSFREIIRDSVSRPRTGLKSGNSNKGFAKITEHEQIKNIIEIEEILKNEGVDLEILKNLQSNSIKDKITAIEEINKQFCDLFIKNF